ncbi:MAG TPA: HEAT repeat domain-containing protein [Pseudomonadales bacterium]
MNPYLEIVDSFKLRAQRFPALLAMTDGRVGARENRGVTLSADKRAALIWGLEHENPVVRRCCLELLDQHPDPEALPHIVTRLHDPVPRVRWHAVHALLCDACKPGAAYACDPEIIDRIRTVATNDPSTKVRAQTAYGLEQLSVRTIAESFGRAQ